MKINNTIYKDIYFEISNCFKNQKYKTFPLSIPNLDKSDKKIVSDVFKRNWVSPKGHYSNKMINELKNLTRAKYISLTNSGSSALELALRLINGNKENEIIVQSLIFASPINAVINTGNFPLFINSDKNFGLSYSDLEKFILNKTYMKNGILYNKNSKNRISAIIVGHIAGSLSTDIEKIFKLCKKNNIEIIEDSSEALGCYYKKKHLGLFGRFGVLSFNGNKIITTGSGGSIFFKNKKDYLKAESMIYNGKKNHSFLFNHNEIGMNISLSDLNASLGYSQIKKIRTKILNRKKTYQYYVDYFNKSKFFEIHNFHNKNFISNYWLTTLKIKSPYEIFKKQLMIDLNKKNINVRDFWACAHNFKIYKYFEKIYDLDFTANLQKCLISLPELYDK